MLPIWGTSATLLFATAINNAPGFFESLSTALEKTLSPALFTDASALVQFISSLVTNRSHELGAHLDETKLSRLFCHLLGQRLILPEATVTFDVDKASGIHVGDRAVIVIDEMVRSVEAGARTVVIPVGSLSKAIIHTGDLHEYHLPALHAPLPTQQAISAAERLLAQVPTDLPAFSEIPAGGLSIPRRDPDFTGMRTELLAVGAAIRTHHDVVICNSLNSALGKTSLALEALHLYGQYFAGGVFWLPCMTLPIAEMSAASCALECGLHKNLPPLSIKELARMLMAHWKGPLPCLVVLDGCESPSLAAEFAPKSGLSRTIVTTRYRDWPRWMPVECINIEPLQPYDAVALFRRFRPDIDVDDPRLTRLIDALGRCASAVRQAGQYLRNNEYDVSIDEYIEMVTLNLPYGARTR